MKRLPAKPYGTACSLTYDCHDDPEPAPEPGHVLRTVAGTCYLIQSVRVVRGHLYKYRLHCLRLDPAELEDSCTVIHPIVWNSRKKRKP